LWRLRPINRVVWNPTCRMLTPVFHPNFDDSQVCIGDFWAASEGLDDLVMRIGRMICYQEFNIKSPLNGLAAKWVEQNARLLPIDSRSVAPPSGRPQSPAECASAPAVPEEYATAASSSHSEPSPVVPPAPDDPWSQKISIS